VYAYVIYGQTSDVILGLPWMKDVGAAADLKEGALYIDRCGTKAKFKGAQRATNEGGMK
jgi:hypothetical protein